MRTYIDRAIERRSDRATQRPSDRATERSSDRAIERPSDRATERSSDRAIERPTERPSDRAIERSSDRAIERSNDRATERSSDRETERPIDRATERSSDRAGQMTRLKGLRDEDPNGGHRNQLKEHILTRLRRTVPVTTLELSAIQTQSGEVTAAALQEHWGRVFGWQAPRPSPDSRVVGNPATPANEPQHRDVVTQLQRETHNVPPPATMNNILISRMVSKITYHFSFNYSDIFKYIYMYIYLYTVRLSDSPRCQREPSKVPTADKYPTARQHTQANAPDRSGHIANYTRGLRSGIGAIFR